MYQEGYGIMDSDECQDAAITLICGLLGMEMSGRNWREYPEEIRFVLERKEKQELIMNHLSMNLNEHTAKVFAFSKIIMFVGAPLPAALKLRAIKIVEVEREYYNAMHEERINALNEYVHDLQQYGGTPVPLEYIPTTDRDILRKKKKK